MTFGWLQRLGSDSPNARRCELTVIDGHAMMAVAKLVRGPRVTKVY